LGRNHARHGPHRAGVRTIALIEGAKGALILLAGLGLLSLVHRDVPSVAEQIVRLSRLDPGSRYPLVFLDAAAHVTDARLWLLASVALVYAAIRGVEAYGLWNARQWAEWFTLVSAGLYLPVEIYQLSLRQTWLPGGVLIVNAAIVAYMVYAVQHRADQNRAAAEPATAEARA